MWPTTFDVRPASWNQLRDQAQSLPLESALASINTWWFGTPWRPYYLHWDDQLTWPDPWQLLSDDIYCELARGLGILYTITLLDRADMVDATLILTEDGSNLVQVATEKYILNWNSDSIVNTFQEVKIRRQYTKQFIL
jgi:hypothetical protein